MRRHEPDLQGFLGAGLFDQLPGPGLGLQRHPAVDP